MKQRILVGLASLFFACAPAFASAATNFEVSGWLPYWRGATSTQDVLPHLSELTEIDPFVYTLKSDGTLLDNAPLTDPEWTTLIAAAKMQHVRVVPTIMTSNGDLLHTLLSDAKSRQALESTIANLVKQNGFDGVDIDFEGKKAADKDNFSTFLKGLYARLGMKWLMCTIEARTPVESRYYGTDIPPDAEVYANDFSAINKYCDRVRIMAYDQQSVDLALDAAYASSSQLYAPVSDPAWVEKVIDLTAKSISKSKIELGIPTYGYEYDVTAYNDNTYAYDILWTFNPLYAQQIAQQYGVTPVRAPWGEMEFTHINDSNSPNTQPVAAGSFVGLAAAAAATTYAQETNGHLDFRLLVWPDAQAIQQKVAMAKALGLRGVSIFKLDGGEDPGIWNVLQGVAGSNAAPSSNPSGGTGTATLSRGLGLGARGADVITLQRILNSDPDTQVAQSGVGSPGHETDYLGAATVRAVQRFQVKYGIARAGSSGYGYVGPSTRAKLNSLAQ